VGLAPQFAVQFAVKVVLPPLQMLVEVAEIEIVGLTIVNVFVDVAFPHGALPVAVNVNVTLPAVISAALGV
jgi:hypothetical protein